MNIQYSVSDNIATDIDEIPNPWIITAIETIYAVCLEFINAIIWIKDTGTWIASWFGY